MTSVDPALSHLAESLAAIVKTDSVPHLRAHLSGRTLPAMGGDEDPADILLRAFPLIQTTPDFMERLARLLGDLISEEVAALTAEGFSPQQLSLLRSALYLASSLPAETNLFSSLKNLLEIPVIHGRGEDRAKLSLPLWQALVYQQTDASLEETWLSLLAPEQQGPSKPAQRTLLLTAWRGLLWIPPSQEAMQAEEGTNFDRIQNGIQTLYRSLLLQQGDDFGQSEVSSFIELCLDILQETFPRSGEFWARNLRSHSADWPSALATIVLARWPLPPQIDRPSPQIFSQEDRRSLDRALAKLAEVDSRMAELKATADDLVDYYETHRLDEALNSIAVLLTHFGPALGVAATRLSRDIAAISRQMELLRAWQEMEKHTLSDVPQVEDVRRQEMIKMIKTLIRRARRRRV
jgi:hypothetical protein